MKIWVDADACPKVIKTIIFKAAQKKALHAYFVANSYVPIPNSPYLHLDIVSKGFDVADHFIVERVEKMDLVITADIPLAALVIEKGAVALNPRGNLYTQANIGDKLASRNLMQEMREGGTISGGPPAIGDKEKQKFANAFDRFLVQST